MNPTIYKILIALNMLLMLFGVNIVGIVYYFDFQQDL